MYGRQNPNIRAILLFAYPLILIPPLTIHGVAEEMLSFGNNTDISMGNKLYSILCSERLLDIIQTRLLR